MSGHALMTLLVGEGRWDQSLLQCHQALIGAPSPAHANHPWYPTVILPTTSPAGLAAGRAAPAARRSSAADRAATAEPASADARTVRRLTPMGTLPFGFSETWSAGRPADVGNEVRLVGLCWALSRVNRTTCRLPGTGARPPLRHVSTLVAVRASRFVDGR